MTLLLFVLRAIPLIAWLGCGLVSVAVVFPFAPLSLRDSMGRRWSAILLHICGVRLCVSGRPCLTGPVLWVANHVSWLDIFVLNSVRSTVFIAKSEIRRWPIIGWLVAGAGTLFIERGRRQAIAVMAEKMTRRFRRQEAIGLFPEGTTSAGLNVGPFHSSLFEPAIRAGVAIQPVALRFFHRGQRSDYVSFVGAQTLVENAWQLLGTTGVRVDVEFLPVIGGRENVDASRRKVSAQAHRAISQAVQAVRGV